MDTLPRIVWIALGGAAGTVARYYVSVGLLAWLGAAFPYGTFAVNLAGSFLLGALFAIGQSTEWLGPTAMLTLTTGFLGGFTTYSTFSLDAFKLLQAGSFALAAGYLAATLVLCLVGTWLGYVAGGWLATGATPAA